MADVPPADVPLVIGSPAATPGAGVRELPTGVVVHGPPTGRAQQAKRRSGGKRRSRLPRAGIVILVGLVLGILLLTAHVRWDAPFPNPEIRWAEIVRLLDEKKWDRAGAL